MLRQSKGTATQPGPTAPQAKSPFTLSVQRTKRERRVVKFSLFATRRLAKIALLKQCVATRSLVTVPGRHAIQPSQWSHGVQTDRLRHQEVFAESDAAPPFGLCIQRKFYF